MSKLYNTPRLRKLSILFLAALILASISSQAAWAALTPEEENLLSMISAPKMMNTIERLCDKKFYGRRAGSPEHYLAADYLVSQLRTDGISALPEFNEYKQPLTMRYSLINSKDEIKAFLSYKSNGTITKNKIFSYRGYNGRGGLDIHSDVVFVGYGIHDPVSGYDDYAGLDVSGKIVFWLPGTPGDAKLTKQWAASAKMLSAYQHGAVACLMYKPASSKDEWGTNVGLSGAIADFPCLAIDRTTADEILSPGGVNVENLQKTPSSNLPIGTHGANLKLQITPVCDPERKTSNIVGMIKGCDPSVSDQIVIIGAHYDHIGGIGGKYYSGADDNASGSAVVLELARIMQKAEIQPKRTIVFALWTGEEAGLIGSNYFVNNLPFPKEDIVYNISLDMVGTGIPGQFMTTGASSFPVPYQYLSTSADDLGYTLKADLIRGASDHLAFSRKRIPSSLISVDGDHPNYHSVNDKPSNLNTEALKTTSRLTLLAVLRAANG